MHPSYVHVHIRRELGRLRAVRALVARLFTALELAVRLHVGESGVTAVASGTMELLPRGRGLRDHVVGPVDRGGHRRYGGFLTARRVDVEIRIFFRLLYSAETVSSRLIGLRGHAGPGDRLGMYIRRVHLSVKRI